MMTGTNIQPSFMHLFACYHRTLNKNVEFLFFLIPPTAIHHILFYRQPCLSNSCDLGQLFFHSRCNPPFLFLSLQWNLQEVSLRQQHCRTSVLLQHYMQPLSSPALIRARGRGDRNGHTQPQSDKMHNRRCCRELGSSGKAA